MQFSNQVLDNKKFVFAMRAHIMHARTYVHTQEVIP